MRTVRFLYDALVDTWELARDLAPVILLGVLLWAAIR